MATRPTNVLSISEGRAGIWGAERSLPAIILGKQGNEVEARRGNRKTFLSMKPTATITRTVLEDLGCVVGHSAWRAE